MSSEIAIRAQALGKSFPVYDKPYHRLLQMLSPGPRDRWYRTFQALHDVSFEVRRGETVGIVGRNGSGKSTLLQLICGTLTPSSGVVEVHGRVAALLELGAGFNPEFTGRENVYLNGSLLGLSRAELDERFDDIAAFADIGEFIEQPVKSYSSGMYIRLAFAVAINVSPDILVIDEALSVGDEAFQRKCFARIDAIRDAGATVLFVSHSAQSVLQLCDRALLLERGRGLILDEPKKVIGYYQKLLYAPPARYSEVIAEIQAARLRCDADAQMGDEKPAVERLAGAEDITSDQFADVERFDAALKPESTIEFESHGATICDPRIVNDQGKQVNVLVPGRTYLYTYDVAFDAAATAVHFGMMIKSVSGIELYGTDSHAVGQGIPHIEPGARFRVAFRFRASMLPGGYFLNAGCVGLGSQGEVFLHRIVDAVMFRIEATRTDRRYAGFFDISEDPVCAWELASDQKRPGSAAMMASS